MYALANGLNLSHFQKIASFLYMEMLESGFTSVGEFHYLHKLLNAASSRRLDPLLSSKALIEASELTGIELCLLPVLYQQGGFSEPPRTEQEPFLHSSVDQFLDLIENLVKTFPETKIGAAIHSLRAVHPSQMKDLVESMKNRDFPLHIHIAEQPAEVESCLKYLNKRPVEFLLENFEISSRWTLVHATHMADSERVGLARSGANICLCPITEANLGDGIFPAVEFLEEGGQICIGSDSNIRIDPFEELRLLEYSQRYRLLQRNRCVEPPILSPGESLARQSYRTGAASLQLPTGSLKPGSRANFLVLDPAHSSAIISAPNSLWDRWIFSGSREMVKEVYVRGRQVVLNRSHVHRERIQKEFSNTLQSLYQEGLLAQDMD